MLVARGLAPTRVKARALILAGQVLCGGVRLDKPGTRIPQDAPLELLPGRRWVSRGGGKLEAALAEFRIDAAGRDALDVGASTGGFTHVLLEAGVRRIAALDVGRGQLDWMLRNDPRVHVLEGVNARHLDAAQLPFAPSLAVVDVSFISLRLVLPAVTPCLAPGGEMLALIKPQFEVGRDAVGRGGIVRDPALHRRVLKTVVAQGLQGAWGVVDLSASAVRGATGNREFFAHMKPGAKGSDEHLESRIRDLTDHDGGAE